ncbi:MAG: ribonuclease II [Rhodanobacter sp. 68-29]|mgnify:CR=1 FL=1|nr:RNB domain-containing ribonuclease [Rhodanobacter sp.]ODU73545.1 MAG: ribonuclease II [Rhodanobacter sp. SCN 69-32]OJY56003.1 MAG: ribonuclease II [Rhodanobacter sp. 68-29]
MPATRIRLQTGADTTLAQGIAAIQRQMKLAVGFPPEVESAATQAAAQPRLPELDRTDIPLVTIDPPGSMDLDQALHLERRDAGYRVHYAIADVAAFVVSGDAVDAEAHRRGETLYGADSRIPLHPQMLSEGAASLLPDQLRPALLWTIDLDASGEIAAVDVRRARVRSRARLDYAGVQQQIDAGTADALWSLLREVGELRQRREQARGGISLALPEQEISVTDGQWQLAYRVNHPVEDWNAQISLLTGMAAAQLMVKGRVGLLRTLPPPDPQSVARLKLTAQVLGIAWPATLGYPDFIRSLDPAQDTHVAMLTACTTVLRGAGYVAFDGELPAQPVQSALAAEYSHATAPLRRLVDRYVGEVCVALCANQPVPDWARAGLPALPELMREADRRARQYERQVIDLVEAVLLAPRVGESFHGAIVEADGAGRDRGNGHGGNDAAHGGAVMLRDPAIEARVSSATPLPLGQEVTVRLAEADPVKRVVRFELVQQVVAKS